MRSLYRIALLVFVSLTVALRAAVPAVPFAHLESDLKPDPAARYGTLPNGLRYVVRANAEPKDRASMRLLVEAGSLHEAENQRGLAHFLEHMAFNGSTNYPDDDALIRYFQRLGMNFGGDTNASTGFERTLYLLELPDTKEATLADGLRMFSDYTTGLLLKQEEIDKERGIILSEKRSGDSVGYRTTVAVYNFLFDGALLPKRFPIGEAEIIQTANRDRFVDFWDTWYRPELTSIVVVGDIDPAAVEKQIIAAFSDFKARAPAKPKPDYGKLNISGTQGVRAFYHHEAEAASTSVSISTLTPYAHETDNAANRVKYLPRSIANAIISRRLAILARKENAPFTSGSASVSEGYDFYRESSIDMNCRADQWSDALAVADQELRRALEFGFQLPELQEVVATYRNSLEQAVKTAATRRSGGIADEITNTILERDVFTTPEADLALYGPALDKITVADCLAALRAAWSPSHRLVVVTGNAKIAPTTLPLALTTAAPQPENAIVAAFEKSRAVAVTAPEAIADVKWAYTDFGAPGKVAKREHVADLDVHLLSFENGVRLNLKKTDFEANRIHISIRLGNGRLTEPRDKRGLATYTNQTYSGGGLGQHSVDDLRRVLAGKTVGGGFGVGADAFSLSGGTNREDLLLQLQFLTANITDPGFREESARQARKAIDQTYLSYEHNPSGPMRLEIDSLLAGGDPRFGMPAKEVFLQRNLDEVKAWTATDRARGAIEIAIVGDLDLDATIDAVARTFGALPKRDARPDNAALTQVKFPAEPFTREFKIPTDIPKGNVILYWPSTDGLDVPRNRRLTMLGEVFSDRLRVKVREELGDAYSPGAGSSASDIYPGYGYFSASVTVDPPKAKEVADIIVAIAQDLAEKGVTAEELERSKKPLLTSIRESARTNGYWLGSVLAKAQERPESLEWSRTRYSDFESITTEELSALAKSYLGSARASRVIIVPDAPPAAAPPAKAN